MWLLKLRPPALLLLVGILLMVPGCVSRTEAVVENEEPPQVFPAADVCGLAAMAPGKVFTNLGGGEWARANSEDPLAYECIGAEPSVRIFSGADSVIDVTYRATGTKDGASMIELTYSASGPSPIPNESTYRNTFANLVFVVSQQSLNAPATELLRRKIGNLASYSEPGKGSAENFDVGLGFILVTREAPRDGQSVSVTARFFPDVALKLKK